MSNDIPVRELNSQSSIWPIRSSRWACEPSGKQNQSLLGCEVGGTGAGMSGT